MADPNTQLMQLNEARQALARASTPEDKVNLRDMAQLAIQRAKQLGLEEIQNEAATFKLEVERNLGKMLEGMEKHKGGRSETTGDIVSPVATLADKGITKKQSQRWQLEASVPEEAFQSYVESTTREDKEITSSGLISLAKKQRRQADRKDTPPLPEGVYNLIYADPPWTYEFSQTHSREIENQYPTMKLEDIREIAVPVADDAVLFLWATSPKVTEAASVIEAWGFTYRTCMVWVKDKIGMGYYARQRHELLFIAIRGTPPVPEPANRPDSVISAPRQEHSRKPEQVYGIIEAMYPGYEKLELFARKQREGWTPWGNEI